MSKRVMALVGNPNVGKSLLFHQLTGQHVQVANFPGTTIEMTRASLGQHEVVDTPGVFGISRFSDEETVTLETVLDADVVINVVDGMHLSRDLFLTLHIRDLGKPFVVVVNMVDEMNKQHAHIDWHKLEKWLRAPVLPVSGMTGEGLETLESLITGDDPPPDMHGVPMALDAPRPGMTPFETLLWHEEDELTVRRVGQAPPTGQRETIYMQRRLEADRIYHDVFRQTQIDKNWSDVLDQWLLHPIGGLVILSALILFVFYFVGVIVADQVVTIFEGVIQSVVNPVIVHLVGLVIPVGSFVGQLLVGQYGMLTAGMTYIVGLLLPLIVAFNLFLAILEDSGYLARLATLLDRGFIRMGLNGRAIIPIVLGFGCVTMATMTTRVLTTERERKIATLLLAWTIPCSAQMGVIIGLLSGLGWVYATTYAAVMLIIFVGTGTLADRLIPGRPAPLLLSLPPLRIPDGINVLEKTRFKVGGFLKEAAPLFLLGSLAIELVELGGILPTMEHALAPVMRMWLGLPARTTSSFLLGFIRRDFGVAEMYAAGLTPHQILTGAVTMTLFVPCIASTLVIIKERGTKDGVLIWIGSIALALLAGGVVARLGPL